jgi:putative endonuclease
MSKVYFTYILANKPFGTFYTGVTNNLPRRMLEHKEGIADSFTKKYDIKTLVYYEVLEDIESAIKREKSIKKWKRSFKINAINKFNPDWEDLYYKLNN